MIVSIAVSTAVVLLLVGLYVRRLRADSRACRRFAKAVSEGRYSDADLQARCLDRNVPVRKRVIGRS